MPLIQSTSKKVFGKNIGAEEKAGKHRKQAVAIAFSEKREAAHKALRRKMHPQVKRMHEYAKER